MAARTAVAAGTAQGVSGRIARRQASADSQFYPGPVPTSPATDDLAAQLERLGQLSASGVLTREEFVAAKARLLG